MAFTLQITDGTDTVDFVADTDIGLLAWPLRVASRRAGALTERSPYEVVRETLRIFITGTSAEDAQQNLLKLSKLLENSQRFANGEYGITAVRLRYESNNTGSRVYEALILGNNNEEMVSLPAEYAQSVATQVVDGLTVTFLREGLWVEPTAENASVGSASESTVATATWTGATQAESPLDISFSLSDSDTHYGYMVIADDMDIQQNGTAASITAATSWQTMGSGPNLTMAEGLPIHMFVKIQNNSSLASWKFSFIDAQQNFRAPIINIPAGSTAVQVIALPPITNVGADSTGWIPRAIADIDDVSETLELKAVLMAAGDVKTFFFDGNTINTVGSTSLIQIRSRFLSFPTSIVNQSLGFGFPSSGANLFSAKGSFKVAFIGHSTANAWDLAVSSSWTTFSRYRGAVLPT